MSPGNEQIRISQWAFRTLVGLGAFLVVQTAAAIWWAAGLSTTVHYLQRDVAEWRMETKSEARLRYTSDDAHRDRRAADEQRARLAGRIESLEGRLARLDGRSVREDEQRPKPTLSVSNR